MDYTVEVYKADKRLKAGERLVKKEDCQDTDRDDLLLIFTEAFPGHRIEIHETYVTRTNIMSGQTFQERYDTPYFCSPSSESYWSM